VHRQPGEGQLESVHSVEQRAQGAEAAVARYLHGQRLLVGRGGGGQARGGRPHRLRVRELQPDVPAGDAALELLGRALGDDPALVEHGDPVGELVGLLEVLGGEEDRHSGVGQLTDDPPQFAPTAGVEARGRLVEEDHLGASDQRHGEVELAAHAAAERRRRSVGRLVEAEPCE
jgi:hypothetical protein